MGRVLIRLPAFFCLGVNALARTKRDGNNVRLWGRPKTRVFSATEILLRIYQNPIHLNGARVVGRRFSIGELHAASKTSSANGSHLNVWDFDISAAEFPQQKKRASLV